ncbi:MAG: hemolysin D [Ignavibacteriae bacterium]|nr:MAG: hemolysin D [Ignavibacteriota bacterium]
MKDVEGMEYYSPREERINIISHAIGFILSVAALILLVMRANLHGDIWHIISFSIFGMSLIILYAASTIYHSTTKPELRSRLRIIDHASIFILIAGTYTPFTLVTLSGTIGWVIFGTSWGLALTGIILKLFFTGKYKIFSTIMYILISLIIVFAIKPLLDNLPIEGLLWLLAGGISYIAGAILYSIKKIKFNHAIFHIFVLIGSFCHFVSVFFFV